MLSVKNSLFLEIRNTRCIKDLVSHRGITLMLFGRSAIFSTQQSIKFQLLINTNMLKLFCVVLNLSDVVLIMLKMLTIVDKV